MTHLDKIEAQDARNAKIADAALRLSLALVGVIACAPLISLLGAR